MQKDQILLGLAILTAVVGIVGLSQEGDFSSLRVDKEPTTVPFVDVQKYLGKWYEQAVIPYYFERDCAKTTATYSLNKDGTIKVDNYCERHGKAVESVGKAIPEDKTNAKLKV